MVCSGLVLAHRMWGSCRGFWPCMAQRAEKEASGRVGSLDTLSAERSRITFLLGSVRPSVSIIPRTHGWPTPSHSFSRLGSSLQNKLKRTLRKAKSRKKEGKECRQNRAGNFFGSSNFCLLFLLCFFSLHAENSNNLPGCLPHPLEMYFVRS